MSIDLHGGHGRPPQRWPRRLDGIRVASPDGERSGSTGGVAAGGPSGPRPPHSAGPGSGSEGKTLRVAAVFRGHSARTTKTAAVARSVERAEHGKAVAIIDGLAHLDRRLHCYRPASECARPPGQDARGENVRRAGCPSTCFLRPRATREASAARVSRERDSESPGRGSGAAQGAMKRTSAPSAQQIFRASQVSAQVNERPSAVRCASHVAPRGHQYVFATDDVSVFAGTESICAFNRRVLECRLRWSRSSVAHSV